MPARVPRVEFSADDYHFDLVKVVTGIEVSVRSPVDLKLKASQAFLRAWNYDIRFDALVFRDEFGELQTNMGHAVYAAEGVDYDSEIRCPFRTPEEVLAFDPWEAYGEIDTEDYTRRFEEQYRSNCRNYPTNVNMSGIYPSLITGLTFIFGWELLLLAAGIDPKRFGELTNRYASWMQQFYDALGAADVPVIYSHDDMVWAEGAIFRPEWYRQYVFPNLERLWDPLLSTRKKVIFVCDGDYTKFAADVAACGASGFWFEIFTDLDSMAAQFGQTHILIGNADTRALLSGSKERIRHEVERCMRAGKPCPGYFIAVSNHLAANTPIESALYYNDLYEEMMWR
jgi:hypothetical protein